MSKLISQRERSIATALNKYPNLKSKLKKLYYVVNYFLHKEKYKISIRDGLTYDSISEEGRDVFFGYYDKSPESPNGKYLLYLSLGIGSKPEDCYLCVFDIYKHELFDRIKIESYNLQQGCKQQWLSEDEFAFNNYEQGQYVSCIYSISKKRVVKKLPMFSSDFFKNKNALSVNFSRLFRLRPEYGYFHYDSRFDSLDDNNDGLFFVNSETNEYSLLLSFSDFCKQIDFDEKEGYSHKFNHLMISPDEKNIIFLHRYVSPLGVNEDQLILMDLQTKKLSVLSDHQMVSHCFWYSSEKVISFLRREDNGDHYYLIDINTGEMTYLNSGEMAYISDGHPNCNKKGEIVFDTYPQKNRLQRLYFSPSLDAEVSLIGEFFSPLRYFGHLRCDLHPRFNYSGDRVYIDTTYNGKRELLWIDLD